MRGKFELIGDELIEDQKEERRAQKSSKNARETASALISGFIVIADSSYAKQIVEGKIEEKFAFHVNCAPELGFAPSLNRESVHIKYKVTDPLEQLENFDAVALKIHKHRNAGGVCLVNCARGRSRSVAVVKLIISTKCV